MGRTISNIIRNKATRKKILFTFAVLVLYRLGCSLTIPGIDTTLLSLQIRNTTLLGIMNLMGGGALERMSIFALGVGPYITAGIIIQLLSMDVIPYLTEQTKNGQKGKTKIEKITRYLALVMAILQALTMTIGFDKQYNLMIDKSFSNYVLVTAILVAGTQALVWLGDQISEKGLGNGISMMIFAGIVSNIPQNFREVFNVLITGTEGSTGGIVSFIVYCVVYILIIFGVIIVQLAVRKVPVMHSTGINPKTGNKSSYLPIKVNSAGVLPVIFASSVISAPQIILSFINQEAYLKVSDFLSLTKPVGLIIYAILTFALTFFYADVQLDAEQISKDFSKQNSYIPKVRPGKDTQDYLSGVIHRVTLFGAIGLLVLALLPFLTAMFTDIPQSAALGGTGIIIVVGVAIETMEQLRVQGTSQRYEGLF